MTEKGIVKALTLTLIASLTVSSFVNIAEKSLQYHDSWSSWLVSVGFAVSFSLTVYIVMIAQTAATRTAAIVSATVFGVVSATIQTSVYIDSGASLFVSLAYGVGVPGFEAALAILHALLSHEEKAVTVTEAHPLTQHVTITDTPTDTPTVKPLTLTVTERRGKLSQLLTTVTVNADMVTRWAKEFGASERTIWRDIAALQPAGEAGD